MPRLFTGLSVPPEVATQLSTLQSGLPAARWIESGDFHITLRFFGDIHDDQADDLASSLGDLAHPSVPLTLNGLGAFGGDKPRMVWIGVEASQELIALQRAQETLAQRLGHKPEGRKYTPHVTLARLRGGSAVDVGRYLSLQDHDQSFHFEANEFVLYSAKASTGGGPYVVEARYPLLSGLY